MQYADRVRETTTTAGTGTVNLAGAVQSYQSFSTAFLTGTQVAYCLVDANSNWEVGYGTLTIGAPSTLSRDVVMMSSNAGALITLSGGLTQVFNTAPARNVDWPTVSETVAAADVVTVQAGRQLVIATNLNILGALALLGDLAIL